MNYERDLKDALDNSSGMFRLDFLQENYRQQGRHPRVVLTYQGRPVKQVNTAAWRKALPRAGITDFRWHDLRHTWASWHVQAGTPLNVLQELGGWESVGMVRRYAHLAADHLAEYAERLARPRMVQRAGTNLVHKL